MILPPICSIQGFRKGLLALARLRRAPRPSAMSWRSVGDERMVRTQRPIAPSETSDHAVRNQQSRRPKPAIAPSVTSNQSRRPYLTGVPSIPYGCTVRTLRVHHLYLTGTPSIPYGLTVISWQKYRIIVNIYPSPLSRLRRCFADFCRHLTKSLETPLHKGQMTSEVCPRYLTYTSLTPHLRLTQNSLPLPYPLLSRKARCKESRNRKTTINIFLEAIFENRNIFFVPLHRLKSKSRETWITLLYNKN